MLHEHCQTPHKRFETAGKADAVRYTECRLAAIIDATTAFLEMCELDQLGTVFPDLRKCGIDGESVVIRDAEGQILGRMPLPPEAA
jgi:hypothetical protein